MSQHDFIDHSYDVVVLGAGGAGLRAIRRAVRYGDGWVPLMSGGDDDPVALLPKLHEQLREAGREVDVDRDRGRVRDPAGCVRPRVSPPTAKFRSL